VSNDIGATVVHAPGKKVVVIISRRAWGELGTNFWGSGPEEVSTLLIGAAQLLSKEDRYVANTVSVSPEYSAMLRALVSGLSHRDGVRKLDYLDEHITPSAWGPYCGVIRRGGQAIRAFRRKQKVDQHRTDNFLVDLLSSFCPLCLL